MNKRRLFVLILSVVLAVSALAGCGNNKTTADENETDKTETSKTVSQAAESDKIKITFLNGFTGGDGEFMRKITDGFNASQSKYEVVESQEKDHLTQFKANGSDLVVIPGSSLYTYEEDGMVQEVSSVYKEAGVAIDDFIPAAQDIVNMNDGLYAFPLDIHPLTMFYNKELVPEAPKTFEDLVDLNNKLQAENSDIYAMAIPGSGLVEYYYMGLAAQNGIDIVNDGYCNFATDEFADTLMKWHDMIFVDKLSPANLGLDAEFTSFAKTADDITTQAAIALTGPWYYSAAKEIYGDNLGIASIPTIGEENATYGGSHTVAVSSQVTDEEKLAGIAAFFNYLYEPENLLNWADSGQTPVHQETLEIIKANPEKYPLPAANAEAVETAKTGPKVYNSNEQLSYISNNIFGRIVSEENLAREELMTELEKATEIARQIAQEQ